MKSFVVMTYYQLMHSIAMALTLEEKPLLYFSLFYLNVEEDFLDGIRKTGIFKDVIGVSRRGSFVKLAKELQQTVDYTDEEIDAVGSSIFDKYLEPMYKDAFDKADPEDTIYVYNDFQYHYYYIEKHFTNIVGIEDGYRSLKQQLKVHRFVGDQEMLEKYLGKYYPLPLYQSPKIKEIISSCYFDDIPDEYKEKLTIIDFEDLVKQNEDRFKQVMMDIFGIGDLEIKQNSLLFLGQPLSRGRYCSPGEEYIFYKNTLNSEAAKGFNVYFKPHPAETINARLYESDNITILSKNFPVEILNYKDCEFEKILSFGSTGIDTLKCAKTSEKIFPKQEASVEEIQEFINDKTKENNIVLDLFFMVRELNEEAVVNVYSSMLPQDKLSVRTHIITPEPLKEEAESLFSQDIAPAVEKYRKSNRYRKVCPWSDKLDELLDIKEQLSAPDVICCCDINDEDNVFATCVNSAVDFDYIMILEEHNNMFTGVRSIASSVEAFVPLKIAFRQHTMIVDEKRKYPLKSLSPGYIGQVFSGDLINRAWHRTAVRNMMNCDAVLPEYERVRNLSSLLSTVRKFSDDFYVPIEKVNWVEDGDAYYENKIQQSIEEYKDDEELMNRYIALQIYSYCDWCKMKYGSYKDENIQNFIKTLTIPEDIKTAALGYLCGSLLFEKSRLFDFNYGPLPKHKDYLFRKEIKKAKETAKAPQKSSSSNSFYRKAKRFLGS